MSPPEPLRVGYVVKRYPRYSETFILNEILAHEAAGLEIEIFSLFPSNDTHFQEALARIRAPVSYLPAEGLRAADLWSSLEKASAFFPGLWSRLEAARGEEGRTVYQAAMLACAVHQKGLHHLHAHFATTATAVARLAGRWAGRSYSFTAHAKDIFHESVQADDLGRKLADAAAVVTVSDYNLEFLRQHYGSAAGRVERVYNGLDLHRFPFETPQSRPARIVSVGRLVEKKGIADLIDACAILARKGCSFRCQIVGEGEFEAPLREQIERLGLQARVDLLGPRPQSEVIRLVQGSAALAAPCIVGADGNRDGLPTVLLEAMALGTPCISTDVTGIPEILRDGITGLMVPQHDPPALALALERLLADRQFGVHLATQARRLIEADFDIHRNAVLLRKLFHRSRELTGTTLPEVR